VVGQSSDTGRPSLYVNSTSNRSPDHDVGSGSITSYATDADYAVVTDFSTLDSLQLTKITKGVYLIGAAPSSFSEHNISGSTSINTTDFGIYYYNPDGNESDINSIFNNSPNLVAEIKTAGGFSWNNTASFYRIVYPDSSNPGTNITLIADGTSVDIVNNIGHIGGSNAHNNGFAGIDAHEYSVNFGKMGAMYDLSQTAFASKVSYV
jgi:hypothetical protein